MTTSGIGKARNALWLARTLGRAGVLPALRPDKYRHVIAAFGRYGLAPATAVAISAVRSPHRIALVDDDGSCTWAELDQRSSALAVALAQMVGKKEPTIAVMARNSRPFVEAVVAGSKIGGRILLLNTGFAGRQVADVLARENADLVVCDDEFHAMVTAATTVPVVIAWQDQPGDAPTVAGLIAGAGNSTPPKPPRAARVVLLTSGTSGTPKGAERGGASGGIGSVAGFLDRIPLRPHDVMVIGAPMCHAWGFAGLGVGASCSATLVMRRRFDPAQTINDVARHRASVLWLVPVMLERIMALAPDARAHSDLKNLRVTALSGSAVRSAAVSGFMDEFGDTVYNSYSSTEVGWAAIATPRDLRQAPSTAGRPPQGTRLKILDDSGAPMAMGATGRIFVHNDSLFEGYTGGGGKEVLDGFMATGDVGHLDEQGRLYIDGRDDEMIVSGGENVYPVEVEILLGEHPGVAETAVIGVPDDDFGQRLVAFVVLQPSTTLDSVDAELGAFVRDNLARHKVPRSFEVIDELPRNATGKILKRELRALVPKTST